MFYKGKYCIKNWNKSWAVALPSSSILQAKIKTVDTNGINLIERKTPIRHQN